MKNEMRLQQLRKFTLVLGLVTLVFPSVLFAQEAGGEGQPAPQVAARNIESLITRAQDEGSIHIIVGLGVSFVPEGKLASRKAVRSQRRAIARAQKALLKELSRYHVTSVKKFQFTPFIAMQVDAAALRFLRDSSQVASIEEDSQVSPTN